MPLGILLTHHLVPDLLSSISGRVFHGVVPGINVTTCPAGSGSDPYPGLYYQNTGGSLPADVSVIPYKVRPVLWGH